VLDVGCGYGELLDHLPAEVTAIDLVDSSPLREERAMRRARERGIPARFFLCDANDPEPGFPPGPYETIVMGALLEHLRPPIRVLSKLRPLLSPGGRLLLTTPTPLGGALHRLGSYVLLTHPEAAQEHFAFYGRADLAALLGGSGYEMEEYFPFLLGLNQLVVARGV
jgi:SAM-dependent methyltransferase